jgi:hypothetical protein
MTSTHIINGKVTLHSTQNHVLSQVRFTKESIVTGNDYIRKMIDRLKDNVLRNYSNLDLFRIEITEKNEEDMAHKLIVQINNFIRSRFTFRFTAQDKDKDKDKDNNDEKKYIIMKIFYDSKLVHIYMIRKNLLY